LAEHDTLTAELAAAREWADQCQLERDAANDSAQDLLNWWQRLKAERDAARDARRNADIYARRFEEQAESAMKERDRLAACVERVRGVRNVLEANHLEAAKVCVDTGYTRGCADTRHLVIEAIDDILAALEGTDAAA
jgi:beta-phosphoglucomutase-like phosphatase (HAD superfamily)